MPPEVIGVGAKDLGNGRDRGVNHQVGGDRTRVVAETGGQCSGRNRVGGGAGSAAGDIGNDRTAAGRDSGTACVGDDTGIGGCGDRSQGAGTALVRGRCYSGHLPAMYR